MKFKFLNFKLLVILILLLAIFGMAKSSWAATYNVTCSGDITTSLTNATNSASSGDTVSISAGSCSVNPAWDNRVGWTDKNITLQGAGHGSCSGSVCNCNPSVDTCITTDQALMSTAGIIDSNVSNATHGHHEKPINTG